MVLCYLIGTIVVVLLMISLGAGDEDPCSADVYKTLSNWKSRFDNHYTYPNIENDDSNLEAGWYYTEHLTILDRPPHNIYACGTPYPIWRKDPRPTLTVNEEEKLELCLFDFFDDCIDTVHITMKLCPGNYYVHRLDPTPSDSAFCFENPCSSDVYTKLSNLESRYDHYNTYPTSVNQDSALITRWYQTGSLTILNRPPHAPWACGTKYPIWQEDPQVTLAENEEIETDLCLYGFIMPCEASLTGIKMRRCPDNFYVYRLRPTPTNSAYCFGEGKAGTAPSYKPVIGTVKFDTQNLPLGNGQFTYTEVFFTCTFTPSSAEELFYRVYWYQNDYHLYASGFSKASDDIGLALTEALFVENGFKMGNEISCEVESFNEEEGPPGPRSERSQPFYVGIKILTPSLSFATNENDDSKRTILLQPTVPIGCYGVDSCNIELTATIPEESEAGVCNGISLDHARCGISILSEKANETPLKVVLDTVETGQYKTDRHAKVYLTTVDHYESRMWRNYALEPITVYLKSGGGGELSAGKICQSNNDPHMYTFDKRRYELQTDRYSAGVYVLFKNDLFNTEVQVEFKRCPSSWHRAYCNCAAAVKTGRDLYTIRTCDGKLYMGYTNCADGYLKVKSLGPNTYQIFLPYGSYVKVMLHRPYGVLLMNIHVFPSTLDVNNARGLCGTLDNNPNNDFHDEHGSMTTETRFVNTWRVTDNTKNMLHPSFNVYEAYNHAVCICPSRNHNTQGQYDHLRDVSCDKNAVASCTKKGKDVSIHDCPGIERRRRSTPAKPKIPPVAVDMSEQHSRYKRSDESQTWTNETAETFCRNLMRESSAYVLCEDVPNAFPDAAIFDCISDILLSGATDWATVSRHTAQSVCGTELTRNTTLRVADYDKQSVAETIESILCENECSGVGNCIEGICECPDTYGGSDCSIDLSAPPTMHGLLDDGLCDEREYPCTHAYCYVYPVSDSPSLTCRLLEFFISWTDERILVATYTVAAEFSTLIEAICPLEGLRRKRSTLTTTDEFIRGYTVSISNDGGTTFSEGQDLFIYDSNCVMVNENDGHVSFVLLENYCWIDEQCVFHGDIATDDNCSVCDTDRSKDSWSLAVDTDGCTPTSTSTKSTLPTESPSVPLRTSTVSDSTGSSKVSSPGTEAKSNSQMTSSSSVPKTLSTDLTTKLTRTSSIATSTDTVLQTQSSSSQLNTTLTTTTPFPSTEAASNKSISGSTHYGLTVTDSTSSVANTETSKKTHTSMSTDATKDTSTPGDGATASTSTNIPITKSHSLSTQTHSTSTEAVRDTPTPGNTRDSHATTDSTSKDVTITKSQTSPTIPRITATEANHGTSSQKITTDGQTTTISSSPSTTQIPPTLSEGIGNTNPLSKDVSSIPHTPISQSTVAPTEGGSSRKPDDDNNLWIIGAVVPSIIVLVVIIVVGTLVCIKKYKMQPRFLSTTSIQPDQPTPRSRQNTLSSLTVSVDKSFDIGDDVASIDYHPPPKPDVSFAQSRALSQDMDGDTTSEKWPSVFQRFLVSQPPSAADELTSRALSQDINGDTKSEKWPSVFQHFLVSQPPSATDELTFERTITN